MKHPFRRSLKFDLLKVGHCRHPECIAMRGGGYRAIDFPALVGLLEHPKHGLMLYDTGYAQHFHTATRSFPECLYRVVTPVTLPPREALLTQLKLRGIEPEDIETIIISHFHADHVAGLRDFPRARFLATQTEHARCSQMGRLGRLRRAFLQELLPDDFEARLSYAEEASVMALPDEWRPFDVAYDLFGDASLLGIDLPGHTASQLGLAMHINEGGATFLVGDACWKIEGLTQYRRPSRLAYPLFDRTAAYNRTFYKLCALQASAHPPRIIPSHCSTTWSQLGGRFKVNCV